MHVTGWESGFIQPHLTLPLAVDEQKGARGKVRECQACAVAPALNAVPLVSIVARRRMQCPPMFPETQYGVPSSSLIKSPSF
jgi:hypothetical protein